MSRASVAVLGGWLIVSACAPSQPTTTSSDLASTPPDAAVAIDAAAPALPSDPYANPCLHDVAAAFAAVPGAGQELDAWTGAVGGADPVPWPRYTNEAANGFGINNHFQGVQRARGGAYLFLTGSDTFDSTAHLFVVHLASKPTTGRWGSNLGGSPARPGLGDRVVAHLDLDTTLWHAGGPSLLGSLLAVPIDHGDPRSEILFFDAAKPEQLALLPIKIEENGAKLGDAVALARTPDHRFLLARRGMSLYTFFVSTSSDILAGFVPGPVTWAPGDSDSDKAAKKFQNISLLEQCDGRLFLIGFFNTTLAPTIVPGSDMAYLYRVEFPNGDYTASPSVTEVAHRELACDGACHFDAVAGAFVQDADHLVLYGTQHYRSAVDGTESLLRLREF